MELVGHGIRVNSLTPTATDPDGVVERAARWGASRAAAIALKQAFEPFRKWRADAEAAEPAATMARRRFFSPRTMRR